MADRYDIEVNDKVDPSLAKKLRDIAKASNDAAAGVERLQKQLATIDTSKVKALSSAQLAASKSAAAQAASEAKLATSLAQTAAAQARATIAQEKARAATTLADAASVKLTTTQTQLASAQERLVGSMNGANAASQKAAAATARAATAQVNLQTATVKLTTAQTQQQIAATKLASAQQQLAASATRAASAQVQLGSRQQALLAATSRTATAANTLAKSNNTLAQSATNATTATIKQQQATLRLQQQQTKLQQQQAKQSGGGGGTGIIFGVSAGVLGHELIDEISNYENLNNRIRVATSSEAEFVDVRARLLEISNKTFTSLEANALVYQRLSPIAARFGKTSDDVYQVITNVNKALAVSGSTAEEARGALIQLSQALGGDFKTSSQELNSILEQAPGIAKTFADQLGTTSTDLKRFAKEGKLSTQDFFKAFEDGGKGINDLRKRFDQLQPSLSQFGQVFSNNFNTAIGKLSEATGAANLLGKAIIFTSDNVTTLAIGAAALFPILIGGLVSSEIAVNAFNAAIFKNPLILGSSILVAAIAAFTTFNDKVNGAGDSVNKFTIQYYNAILKATQITIPFAALWDAINGTNYTGELKQAFNDALDLRNGLIASTKASEDLYKSGKKIPNSLDDATKHAAGLNDQLDKTSKLGKTAGNILTKSFADVTKAINNASVAFLSLNQELANFNARGGSKVIDVGTALADQGVRGTTVVGGKPINSITGEEYSNLASGGAVRGPGGPRDDMVPAMLSNGEYVVNSAAAAKYSGLLNAINKSPIKMADGGMVPTLVGNVYGNTQKVNQDPNTLASQAAGNQAYASSQSNQYATSGESYLPSNYLPATNYAALGGPASTDVMSFTLGGSELDALLASGLAPYIGMNGSKGGWEFTGQYGPDVLTSFNEQSANISRWTQDLSNWWTDTSPTITDTTVRSQTNDIVNSWLQGMDQYTIDPRPYVPGPPIGAKVNPDYDKLLYHFEDVTSKFLSAGYTAAILQTAPPWGDTLGNYVNYSGPSYGGSISYGGDPGAPTSYAITGEDIISAVAALGTGSQYPAGGGVSANDPVSQFFGSFRNGGSFVVGGDGGPDSQLVQMMASPGERVDVTPEGRAPRGSDAPHIGAMFGPGAIVIQTSKSPGEWRQSEDQVTGEIARKVFDYAKRKGLAM